jgi:aspartate racemase
LNPGRAEPQRGASHFASIFVSAFAVCQFTGRSLAIASGVGYASVFAPPLRWLPGSRVLMSETPARGEQAFIARVPFRVGIVGGMGPMAGVYFQRLIIEATPAARDQDHFEVVCFTNPHVPERMQSLAEDGGRRYAAAVRASARLVEQAGATHIVIPCNTAHARLAEIQEGVRAPILDMVAIGLEELATRYGRGRRAGLLATTGTIDERVYQRASAGGVSDWILPDPADQRRVSQAILRIKLGETEAVVGDLRAVARRLADHGAELIVVGCTELSMCYAALEALGVPLVDPLRVMARHLVELGRRIQ